MASRAMNKSLLSFQVRVANYQIIGLLCDPIGGKNNEGTINGFLVSHFMRLAAAA